jgi:hypothetical protein
MEFTVRATTYEYDELLYEYEYEDIIIITVKLTGTILDRFGSNFTEVSRSYRYTIIITTHRSGRVKNILSTF